MKVVMLQICLMSIVCALHNCHITCTGPVGPNIPTVTLLTIQIPLLTNLNLGANTVVTDLNLAGKA
jgi:hypothetical protein